VAAGLGLALVALIAWRHKVRFGWRAPLIGGAVLVALVGGAIAVGGLDREVLSEASKSLGYRVQYWRASAAMIGDRPWWGCGPGQFQDFYTEYKLPEASEEVADPHNFLLEIWATAGTPAALALLAVLACFGVKLARNKVSVPKPDGPDAMYWIFGGALFGVVASWPLGFFIGVGPPGLAVMGLGLPLAAMVLWGLQDWIERGELPAWLVAVGLGVLLVNLLAAGGISFPGVAGTFWVLLAVGLFGAVPKDASETSRLTVVVGLIASVVLTGLAVGCYVTAYRPVVAARAPLNAAWREPSEAAKHLRAATQADRFNPEPWELLSSLAFAQWQVDGSTDRFREFEDASAETLRRAPRADALWASAADRYFKAFEMRGHKEWLEKAIRAYRRAAELYPNNAVLRAKLAVALHAAGHDEAMHLQRAAALELESQNPHDDKRIPPELRARLLDLVPSPAAD
ncbi:MAG: O-antigen ligase family protein, partial [Pirellulales bacterium]|nr:O-antigen ligase family protein [Pirellulales bacterium]